MATRRLTGRPIILASVVALLAAGCSGSGTKVGGENAKRITLTMQTPDAPDADAEFFIREVARRTDGRIRIVEGTSYPSDDPDNEARLVRALRDGREQMAYVPSRAWERASSITVFAALQAPLLVTDYTLLRRVTNGSLGRSMLQSLGRIGVTGLGLVPNELRRPLGRRPLVSASTFRGARIRVVTSPTSVLALRALGARPLTSFTSYAVEEALRGGRLDGVESSMHSIEGNSYAHDAPYLPSNLALFAKSQTIAIGRATIDRLSARDADALRTGAAATVEHAKPAAQERAEARRLCSQGLRVVEASASGLGSLRRLAQSAYAELERDRSTKAAIRAIERLARELPEADASLPECPGAQKPPAASTTGFPQGRFASMVTEDDFARVGEQRDPGFPEPFVITIRSGRWHTNEHPALGGRYVVRGDEITFVIERPRENKGERETVRWSYYRARLSFQIVDVAGAGSRVIYTAHPWRKLP